MNRRQAIVALASAIMTITGLSHIGNAQTLIDEWASAKLPPAPALKPVKIANAKETALLVMDFTRQTCSQQRRPRCAVSVPKVAKLVAEARSRGALVIFSVAVPKSTPADLLPGLPAAAGEQVLPPLGPDKFINSDLEQTLKSKGIKTVIAMGTQAQTSVLHTGAAAALRGFNVIVPVDAMSADDIFPEAYTAWHLSTAARIAPKTTLTRLDMIAW
jgi:nicotinamidase-related amidase